MWGSEYITKAATLQGDFSEFVPSVCAVGLGPVVSRARVLAHEVLDRGARAVARGATRCASQALECGAQATARGAVR
jgi:hypothetical protein